MKMNAFLSLRFVAPSSGDSHSFLNFSRLFNSLYSMSGNRAQLILLRTITLGCISLLAASANAGPGALDPTFAPMVTGGAVYATAVQPDGRILLGGAFAYVNGSSARSHFARLFADGSLDTSFFNTGSGVSGNVWCLAVQTDGRIVIGGDFSSVNGTYRTRVARLNANGTVDASFVPTNTISSSVLAVAAQSDNKVIVGGSRLFRF
jgi:uncharacterized delta-60 repeat protein